MRAWIVQGCETESRETDHLLRVSIHDMAKSSSRGSDMSTRATLRKLASTAALVLVGACGWGMDLDSDPASWSPLATDAGSNAPIVDGSAEGTGAAVPPECDQEPAFEPGLTQSSATVFSHLAGQPCLEKCHEAGGTARLAFAVGGTIHQRQGQRAVVTAGGTVQSVAGTTLVLDRCGNFYAVQAVLATSPQLTQPFVQNPTLRRMEKPLFRESHAGSCNRVGCHDFSSSSRSGIYY